MCTVSVISMQSGAYRVVCNRDERWERADAAPPRWRRLAGGARAVWPEDRHAGGTWIAANDHGLTLVLLNLNPIPQRSLPPRDRLVSRGSIIPSLIGSTDGMCALDRLGGMELNDFAPFRLVAISAGRNGDEEYAVRVCIASWNGRSLRIQRECGVPACFVSSGLGDRRVAPRLGLFNALVRPVVSGEIAAVREAQDAFHRHTWKSRRNISVMMTRKDARTVSVTTVEVAPGGKGAGVEMKYRPVPAGVLPGPMR